MLVVNKRSTATRIEYLREQIQLKRTAAARIRDRMSEPAHTKYGEDSRSAFDYRKRELTLIDGIDKANALDAEADRLQAELDELCSEVLRELEKKPDDCHAAKASVKFRLCWACTWSEIAELTGYNERSCRRLFDKWLND